MASTTETYTKYVARIRAKDPSVLLGSLCWYSVAEATRVNHADLEAALTDVGLERYLPAEPKDDDVFRRVCTGHQRKKVETDDPDVYENYLMRDVVRSEGRVVKHIVVEQVDQRGEKLSHKAAVALTFESSGSQISVSPLGSPPNKQAMNLADLIRKDFRRERRTFNAYTIRELFRKVVLDSGATIVRPTGGVYFVMEKHRGTVDALSGLAKAVSGVTFHPVPLINDDEQAAMLRDAIEAETREQITKTLDEIDVLMDGPEITSKRYSEMVQQMNSVKGRTVEYAELLDDTLAGCNLLVKSYDAKMRKLFLHVSD